MEDVFKQLELNGELYDYLIYSDGRIYSLNKKKFLKFFIAGHGYLYAHISHNKIKKNLSVHRLVAIMFIPNPDNKPTVNHKNGNKMDIDYNNLEWATYEEQIEHAYRTKLNKNIGENSHFNKYPKTKIIDICKRLTFTDDPIYKIAKDLEVPKHLVSDVYGRRKWKHVSMSFIYEKRIVDKSMDIFRDIIYSMLYENMKITPREIANKINIEHTERFRQYVNNIRKYIRKRDKSSTTIEN